MKFDLSCKDVTRLVLQAQDRALTLGERLGMRFHLAICTMCPPFVRQVQLMRRALGRWKQYGDGEPPPS
jgi:hypothetical protein